MIHSQSRLGGGDLNLCLCSFCIGDLDLGLRSFFIDDIASVTRIIKRHFAASMLALWP